MATLCNELQLRKAQVPITVTESGIVTLASEPQASKALSPTTVTEWEMATLANELQQKKAASSISMTPTGISTTSKSFTLQPDVEKLQHVTGLMLSKAITSVPGMASDTFSSSFNKGLSPTITSTELMLRNDSSPQGSHPCSCLLNLPTVMSGANSNDSVFPDGAQCTVMSLATDFLAANCFLKRFRGIAACQLCRFRHFARDVGVLA